MNEKENTRIVQEGYALYVKGDIPNLMKLYSPDIEWVVPGPTDIIPYAGTHRGHQQLMEFFTLLNKNVTFEQFEPREFIAQGDKVAVLGYSRGRINDTDRMVEYDWMHLLTMQDGKVARFQAFEDTAATVTGFSPQKARVAM